MEQQNNIIVISFEVDSNTTAIELQKNLFDTIFERSEEARAKLEATVASARAWKQLN